MAQPCGRSSASPAANSERRASRSGTERNGTERNGRFSRRTHRRVSRAESPPQSGLPASGRPPRAPIEPIPARDRAAQRQRSIRQGTPAVSPPQFPAPASPLPTERLNCPLGGPVAQSVEHLTENQGVGSSILPWATIFSPLIPVTCESFRPATQYMVDAERARAGIRCKSFAPRATYYSVVAAAVTPP